MTLVPGRKLKDYIQIRFAAVYIFDFLFFIDDRQVRDFREGSIVFAAAFFLGNLIRRETRHALFIHVNPAKRISQWDRSTVSPCKPRVRFCRRVIRSGRFRTNPLGRSSKWWSSGTRVAAQISPSQNCPWSSQLSSRRYLLLSVQR